MRAFHRFPQLDRDAPQVPDGLRPKEGVEYGCGKAECVDCYEPDPNSVDLADDDQGFERTMSQKYPIETDYE